MFRFASSSLRKNGLNSVIGRRFNHGHAHYEEGPTYMFHKSSIFAASFTTVLALILYNEVNNNSGKTTIGQKFLDKPDNSKVIDEELLRLTEKDAQDRENKVFFWGRQKGFTDYQDYTYRTLPVPYASPRGGDAGHSVDANTVEDRRRPQVKYAGVDN